jgi:hypothetical protein
VTHLLVCAHEISVLDKNTNAMKNTAAPTAAKGVGLEVNYKKTECSCLANTM